MSKGHFTGFVQQMLENTLSAFVSLTENIQCTHEICKHTYSWVGRCTFAMILSTELRSEEWCEICLINTFSVRALEKTKKKRKKEKRNLVKLYKPVLKQLPNLCSVHSSNVRC